MLAGLLVLPAAAQFGPVWGGGEVQRGQHANFFAHWQGRQALAGAIVELPSGWTLLDALAVRQGYEQVPLRVRRHEDDGDSYTISAPKLLSGPHELILRVETGGLAGRAVWTLTPYVREAVRGQERPVLRPSLRVASETQLINPVADSENQVLAFRGEGPPLLLHRHMLPDLGTQAPHTVEFWLRTTDLNEVVLSAWTGEEHRAYPIEIVVDAAGRLRYYRGRLGTHQSMTTQRPVADGRWHHLALSHDPQAGWTHLFLDGQPTDSLYSPDAPLLHLQTDLAVGGRLPARTSPAEEALLRPFTGLLDELRLWPGARPAESIRRTLGMPLPSTASGGAVFLSFDEPLPEQVAPRPPARLARLASDLVFYRPVRNVQAEFDGDAVVLTWEATDPHTRTFLVERSGDGQRFEVVGEVEAFGQRGRREPYRFRDATVRGEVAFYRIRQRFESGAERRTSAIKLGMGREEALAAVALQGNFPNPFNPQTTIRYEVREAQRVHVSVWDLSGQQVAVLVDRAQQPGTYEVAFDGQDLPSGTYFVRLQARNRTQTHKMILMK